jgi:hypothetical protein
MANEYDEKQFDEVMKLGQEALKRGRKSLERSRDVMSGRKPSGSPASDSLSVALEDLRQQNAEGFALNQKIRSDVHDVFMNAVGHALDKRPDPGVPASISVPTTQGGTAGKNGNQAHRIAPFPNRASWVKEQMLKCGWSTADPSKYGGPDRKTVEKILRGESVRNDVLEKLADALSKKHLKISVIDVPQD